MIYLLTGQPGHGKTLFAIKWGKARLAELRKDPATAHLNVYAVGIRGHKPEKTGFVEISYKDFTTWQDFPDGSVFILDEAYEVLAAGANGKAIPEYIQKLATHRHTGKDFLVIAQLASQLHTFAKGLVHEHMHIRRKFGTENCVIAEWSEYQTNIKAAPVRRTIWRLDHSLYDHYDSATQHTVKRKIPWYFYALPLAIILTVGAFVAVPKMFISRANELESQAGGQRPGAQATGAGLLLGAPTNGATLRTTDPVAYLTPRTPGAPWTAPAFDDADLGAPPDIACMASEKSCICMTLDQGTRWHEEEHTCRVIARYGRWDPARAARGRGGAGAPPPPGPTQPPPAAARTVSNAATVRPVAS